MSGTINAGKARLVPGRTFGRRHLVYLDPLASGITTQLRAADGYYVTMNPDVYAPFPTVFPAPSFLLQLSDDLPLTDDLVVHVVSYQKATSESTVRLEYSTDSGGTWHLLFTAVGSPGDALGNDVYITGFPDFPGFPRTAGSTILIRNKVSANILSPSGTVDNRLLLDVLTIQGAAMNSRARDNRAAFDPAKAHHV